MTDINAHALKGGNESAFANQVGVCVAVPTYRRPELLAQLLDHIATQSLAGLNITVRIFVLDNDGGRSGEATVRSRMRGFPFDLNYVAVPDRGLANVRNAALRIGRNYDLLAMIDDDEWPVEDWLASLVRMQAQTQADVVVGPVIPDSTDWLVKEGFLGLPHPRDGETLDDGYSGNCLLRMASIGDLLFATKLNFAGGEDQVFFRTMVRDGAKIVFAERAVAWEHVGPERARPMYVVALEFRKGNRLAICDRMVLGTTKATFERMSKGIGLVAIGSIPLLCVIGFRNRISRLRSYCRIARGIGMVAGVFGLMVLSYQDRSQTFLSRLKRRLWVAP